MRRVILIAAVFALAGFGAVGPVYAAPTRTPFFRAYPTQGLRGTQIVTIKAKGLRSHEDVLIEECNGNFPTHRLKACSDAIGGVIQADDNGMIQPTRTRVSEGHIGTDGGMCLAASPYNNCNIVLIPYPDETVARTAKALLVPLSFST